MAGSFKDFITLNQVQEQKTDAKLLLGQVFDAIDVDGSGELDQEEEAEEEAEEAAQPEHEHQAGRVVARPWPVACGQPEQPARVHDNKYK